VRSSDETGDEASRAASTTGGEAESGKVSTHAFRERIRRASVTSTQAGGANAAEALPDPETHSSLPPEHSGVRARPDEPPASSSLPAPVFLTPASSDQRSAPRAWPFAPSDKVAAAKRAASATQLGLGAMPAQAPSQPDRRVTPVDALAPPAAAEAPRRTADPATRDPAAVPETPEARRAKATLPPPLPRRKSKSGAAPTNRNGSGDDARPAERDSAPGRADTASSSPGAYSVTGSLPSDAAVSWSPTITKPQRPALLRAPEAPSDAGRYSVSDSAIDYVAQSEPIAASDPVTQAQYEADEDPATRARRFTPKQRPAHRRGRKHDSIRNNGSPRGKEERPDLARTLPDLQPVRGAASAPPVGANPGTLPSSGKSSAEARSAELAAASTATTKPTLPTSAPVSASILVDPAMFSLPAGSPSRSPQQPTALGHPKWPAASDFVPPPSYRALPSSTVASRKMTQPTPAPPSAPAYQPLPNDRAGFEAFMQKRSAELRDRAGGLHWNEQETLLIPREALSYPPKRSFSSGVSPTILAVGGLVLLLAAVFGLRRGNGDAVRAVPLDTSTSAASKTQSTLIATEPSGAELVLGDAVLGNTPLEVGRPKRADQTYLVRLRGFEPQMVRLTPYSGTTIRVMLQPVKP
jgi:hypothetical protein